MIDFSDIFSHSTIMGPLQLKQVIYSKNDSLEPDSI